MAEEEILELRERCRKIFSILSCPVKYSVRKISKLAEIPKSSVHRHAKAIERRNLYPESFFWEIFEGQQFLNRLIFATIFVFGIMCGVGAGRISFFFKLLRLTMHVGVSPASVRNLRTRMEEIIIEYQKVQEKHCKSRKPIKVAVGADETFFNDMILVFMDLASGYIFFEEEAQNRSYETWMEKVQKTINELGISIKYVVSDRAKALIKLALKGIGCQSIPDLFHASNEIVKLLGLSLNRKYAAVQDKIAKATATLSLLIELSKGISEIEKQQLVVKNLNKEQQIIESAISRYKEVLHKLSKIVHPFDITDTSKQTSDQVQILLMKLPEVVKKILNDCGIIDKKDRLSKFAKQIEAIASLIDAWWLWVMESLDDYEIDDECRKWLLEFLLPAIYWQSQAAKTKNPELKKSYQVASEQALAELEQHPLTPIFITQQWLSWAEWMVSNFQRTSSAVEGRNGCLSQMHHNGRGLSIKRLKALTVIHNFGITRPDGTTAAERLFERDFPDLFEWIVNQMGDLPLARMGRKSSSDNLLNLQIVPA